MLSPAALAIADDWPYLLTEPNQLVAFCFTLSTCLGWGYVTFFLLFHWFGRSEKEAKPSWLSM